MAKDRYIPVGKTRRKICNSWYDCRLLPQGHFLFFFPKGLWVSSEIQLSESGKNHHSLPRWHKSCFHWPGLEFFNEAGQVGFSWAVKNPMTEFPVYQTISTIFPATLTLPLMIVPPVTPTGNRKPFAVAASCISFLQCSHSIAFKAPAPPLTMYFSVLWDGRVFWALSKVGERMEYNDFTPMFLSFYIFGVSLLHHSKELHDY